MKSPDLYLVGAATLMLVTGVVPAQGTANFPGKTITLIIPYTPGSTNDIEARIYREGLAGQLKQRRWSSTTRSRWMQGRV